MSQPPNSPKRATNNQPVVSAFADYQNLTAAGAFNPSSSLAPVHSEQWMNAPASNIMAPTSSANAPYVPPRLPTNGLPAAPSTAHAPARPGPRFPPSRYQTGNKTPTVRGPFAGGHMPNLSVPVYQPARPVGLTREMVTERIRDLLNAQLGWSPSCIDMTCSYLTHLVIFLGQDGKLGPDGIQGADEIFIVVGYEGTKRYMGLAVNAPEKLIILLGGRLLESMGRNHLVDAAFMEEIRKGFHHAAFEVWAKVNEQAKRPSQ